VHPLIVTAALAPELQERFDRLRRRHFPAERNHLAAHVTLFHHLPGEEVDAVAADLAAAVVRPAPVAEVVGVRFLGRGVAFDLRSPEVDAVRAELARRWRDRLVPQDRGRRRLHVTVQNKVAPEVARAVHAALAAEFVPEAAAVPALELWRYLGGPWEPVSRHPFAAPAP
jgi:2'-5' RNA ligase superfamily protein